MAIEHRAWPYKQATLILEKHARETTKKDAPALLQTGFGPSGLPHIGTFGEVARTSWVRQAYTLMTGQPAALYAFSDDMDGMRGIPDTVPDPQSLVEHLGKPLSAVPDPFEEQDSFSGYSNAMLRHFLDSFGFEYTFKSSRDQYMGGVFNPGLRQIVAHYDEVHAICAAELREETRAEWSPFQPICQSCGRVTTTRVTGLDRDALTVSYQCDRTIQAKVADNARVALGLKGKTLPVRGCGHAGEVSVLDGHVKVGWKVDWAMRWYVFGVDYEMYGKDLIDSARVSSQLVQVLGGEPPVGMAYEWFNDERGESISKTKGNGLEIDDWLKHGPLESLSWYIYQTPTKAKKLHAGVIPRSVDDYLEDRRRFGREDEDERANNPVRFVEHARVEAGEAVAYESEVTFGLLLNLVGVLGTRDPQLVWDYLLKYDPSARQQERLVSAMIACAMRYDDDVVAPTRRVVPVPQAMWPALDAFKGYLAANPEADADAVQTACYEAGKAHELKLNKWFEALYQLLLGQSRGPRIGTFASLYGVPQTLALIEARMAHTSAQ